MERTEVFAMHIRLFLLACVLTGGLISAPILSQTTSVTSSSALGAGVGSGPATLGITGGVMGSVAGGFGTLTPVKGQPYTATETETTIKTLLDGTTITHVTHVRMMRDEEGRERREYVTLKDGAFEIQTAFVDDPVQRTSLFIVPRNQTATVTLFPVPNPRTPGQEALTAERRAKADASREAHPAASGDEVLPGQTIAGVYADGRRHTLVIPAGREGNDREIRITTETWTSPELKIVVQSTTDDPRNGKTTRVVSDLERVAPDPELFQVPAGYAVTEREAPSVKRGPIYGAP